MIRTAATALMAFVLVVLPGFGSAHASMTYDYTGSAFFWLTHNSGLGDNVTGQVTFNIGPHYTGTVDYTSVTASTFSAGGLTISNPPSAYESNTPKGNTNFLVTFSNGTITSWNITLWDVAGGALLGYISTKSSYGDSAGIYSPFNENDTYNPSTGTWTAVPLPPALVLLAPGLAGLAAVRRRLKG